MTYITRIFAAVTICLSYQWIPSTMKLENKRGKGKRGEEWEKKEREEERVESRKPRGEREGERERERVTMRVRK